MRLLDEITLIEVKARGRRVAVARIAPNDFASYQFVETLRSPEQKEHPQLMSGSARRRCYDLSTDPAQGAVRREIASALGMLVILFNLIAGTALAASSGNGTAPFLDEIFSDRIVICTGAGMIVLDADGNPVLQDGGVDPMCVYCLPMMAGNADAPAQAVLVDEPLRLEIRAPDVVALVAPTTEPIVVATSPRGPPLV